MYSAAPADWAFLASCLQICTHIGAFLFLFSSANIPSLGIEPCIVSFMEKHGCILYRLIRVKRKNMFSCILKNNTEMLCLYFRKFIWFGCCVHLDYIVCLLAYQTLCHLMPKSSLSWSWSSSCPATNTDIPDPLSSLIPIAHRFWQVLRATSRNFTVLVYVCSSWSSCFCLAIWGGP